MNFIFVRSGPTDYLIRFLIILTTMESSDVDPLLEELLFPSDGRAAYLLRLVEKHGERVLQLLEEL